MWIFIVEAVVLCAVFSVIVMASVLKDPKAWINDYPPAVKARALELGVVDDVQQDLKGLLKAKAGRILFSAVAFALIVFFVNGADTFVYAFGVSYALWFIIAWYDALILDCIWACHSKKVRIPGTEDMDKEYKDYGFHIKMSALGCVLGIPLCALAGVFAAVLGLVI